MSKLHFRVNELKLQADSQRERVNGALAKILERDGVLEALADSRDVSGELPDGVSDETREAFELLAEFQREIGPVELPDFDDLQRFLLWLLAHYTRRSMDLDNTYRQRGQQDWVARRRRETATKAAYDALVMVRGTVSLALDPRAAASILDLEGDTPYRTFGLISVLPNAIRRMRDPKTYFPELQSEALAPDWDSLAGTLEEALEELVDAQDAWVIDKGRIQDGREKRRDVIERYQRLEAAGRHLFKGLALLADDPAMARALVFRERAKPKRSQDPEAEKAPDTGRPEAGATSEAEAGEAGARVRLVQGEAGE